MANFYKAHIIVADNEGGYQNNPNDPGNYNSLGQNVGTNWGINAKVYETYLGYPPTKSQMRSMKKDTSKKIFRKNYWDKIGGDYLVNQQVAEIYYDGAVNHGSGLMTKFVQRIVGVADDGIVGPVTIAAINNADPVKLYNDIKEKRISFYHWLVERRPSLSVFLAGWLKRMSRFKSFFFGAGRNWYACYPQRFGRWCSGSYLNRYSFS